MRILFIENRYTTNLWDAVARELSKKGHQIFWIVQNKEFTPETGEKFFIQIPPRKLDQKDKIYDADINKVLRAHRGINYFMVASDDHVFYAREQIKKIVEQICPDVAFGECTLHHEILTMQILRHKDVPYFFPTSCRFPVQRFSFYWYDSLMPFKGSGEKMPYDLALTMAGEIGERRLKPVFLKNPVDKPPGFVARLLDKLKLVRGYVYSDRFNTPSVMVKLRLKNRSASFRSKWDKLATEKAMPRKNFKILYPLQMQPEATIDTWATEFNNQAEIVRNILRNTPTDVVIVIKPNPTSSLEINDELLDLVRCNSRVIPLSHSEKMDDIIGHVNCVVTTTGTIGIECIFANIPSLTLIRSYFNEAANCLFLENYKQLPAIVESIKNGAYPSLSDTEKVDYLNYLNQISYPGNISCTFIQRSALSVENVNNLVLAFTDVIENISIHETIENVK